MENFCKSLLLLGNKRTDGMCSTLGRLFLMNEQVAYEHTHPNHIEEKPSQGIPHCPEGSSLVFIEVQRSEGHDRATSYH